MDERDFLEQRQATWQKLAAILERSSTSSGLKGLSRDEVKALGPLYRRTASDLAYARAHAISEPLVKHLNSLVARGYALLYQTDTRQWGGFRQFFMQGLPETFRRRLPFFLASVGLLLFGGLLGYVLVAQNRDNIDIFVPPGSAFRKSLEAWEAGQVSDRVPDGAAAEYASSLMQNNIRVSFMAFAAGILGGIFTAYILFYNGAILGAFAGMMTHDRQHGNFWPGIIPHGIVELSVTCFAGAAGLSLGWALLAPGAYRRRDALVLAARDSVGLVIGGVFLLIFAGLVEGFLSHSLLAKPVKIGFGLASGVALYSYLFFVGRKSDGMNAESPQGINPRAV
jgi:uncharacterized membrane protein SpoIIM required for sporulation